MTANDPPKVTVYIPVYDREAYIGAEKGLAQEGAPALVRLITVIATRFGIVVSEKAAAQAVPIIGGVGGAVINTLFIDHFQLMARGHFTVRRCERAYGVEIVRDAYNSIETNSNRSQKKLS